MSKVSLYQTDFSSGEISPRLRGRVGDKMYAAGLAHCENFEVTPQGSLEMRTGTQFVIATGEIDAVLHTFARDIGNDIIVVIGIENVTLYNRGGPISAPQNLIVDPKFLAEFDYWEWEIEGEGNPVALRSVGLLLRCTHFAGFLPPNSATVYQEFGVTLATGVDFTCKITPIQTVLANMIAIITISLLNQDGSVADSIVFNWDTDAATYPPVGIPIDVVLSAVPTGDTMTISFKCESPDTPTSSSLAAIISEIVAADSGAAPITAQWSTPIEWKDKLRVIHSCADSSEGRMFFTCFGAAMYDLKYQNLSDTWNFQVFTPFPPNSGDGGGISWTDNYPATCTIHQGRLWLAGSPDNRSAIWGSETFNYDNFALPSSPVGDSPLEFEVASSGAIQWIEGLKFLLIGTDLGEIIARSSGAVITSSDFDFPREQTWGSTRIQPAEVGNKLLFVTSDLSKVRSLFDGGDAMNGYNAIEETFVAEHLTRRRIGDIVFAKNPRYQLSCLLSSGSLAQSTIYDGANINAWYRMTMNSSIHSITTSNDIIGTSLWMAVNRLKGDGSGDRELILEVKNADNAVGYNLDSWVSGTIDNNQLLGLDHLNGREVSVIINDQDVLTLHPPRTPVGGAITLEPWAIGAAIAGIPYTATATTLPSEGMNPAGTSAVQAIRHNQIYLRLIDSAFPKINGQRAAEHYPSTPMGESPPLLSTDVRVSDVNTGDGTMIIEQDLPLPTHITAIYTKSKGEMI